MTRAVAAARRLADEVLFPDAMRVDRLDVLPAAHLDALAAEGLWGAAAPPERGGLGLSLPDLGAPGAGAPGVTGSPSIPAP